MEIDGQAFCRRIGPDLGPNLVRRIKLLERDCAIFLNGPMKLTIADLPLQSAKFFPQHFAKKFFARLLEQSLGLFIQVGESPLPVQ